VYIISIDTCPPFYWYSGVIRRTVSMSPPCWQAAGLFLMAGQNVKRHLNIDNSYLTMMLRACRLSMSTNRWATKKSLITDVKHRPEGFDEKRA
jgi:hypothetical protein